MGRRKDSLNSGTALRSPQLTALAASLSPLVLVGKPYCLTSPSNLKNK
jgi:hypothetical protein